VLRLEGHTPFYCNGCYQVIYGITAWRSEEKEKENEMEESNDVAKNFMGLAYGRGTGCMRRQWWWRFRARANSGDEHGAPVAYLDSFRNVPARAARYTNVVRIELNPSK
jgi:hypothetical protein